MELFNGTKSGHGLHHGFSKPGLPNITEFSCVCVRAIGPGSVGDVFLKTEGHHSGRPPICFHQSTEHFRTHTPNTFTFTCSHLADVLIQSDLQGHSPETSRVKCLAQGHNVIWHGRELNWRPSDY